jgi:hypothetical protein
MLKPNSGGSGLSFTQLIGHLGFEQCVTGRRQLIMACGRAPED